MEIKNKKQQVKCVHTEHCDYNCCKYGEEEFCPVYLGFREPTYPKSKKPTKKEFRQRLLDAEMNSRF